MNETVENKSASLQLVFNSENEFRIKAPKTVAKGIIELCPDLRDKDKVDDTKARLMDVVINSIPQIEEKKTLKNGTTVISTSPAYKVHWTEPMLAEVDMYLTKYSVDQAHDRRMEEFKKNVSEFKTTIPFNEALFRLSYYLDPNFNNLAKSANMLFDFVKGIILDKPNNMLVDSAQMVGGQGKSTIQKSFIEACTRLGLASSYCHLPTYTDGTQRMFVENECCVDDETTFRHIDVDSLNKVLDKSDITIKGKYVKEWSAKSTANLLVGSNFLPRDINQRRYSVRWANSDFQLIANYGRWGLPGVAFDKHGSSYSEMVEWCTEAWMNLFAYAYANELEPIPFEDVDCNYNLQYKIKKAIQYLGSPNATITDMVRQFELIEDVHFDNNTKQMYKGELYTLARRLSLDTVERHKGMYSVYDWDKAAEIDESNLDADSLEIVSAWFDNVDRFKLTPCKQL